MSNRLVLFCLILPLLGLSACIHTPHWLDKHYPASVRNRGIFEDSLKIANQVLDGGSRYKLRLVTKAEEQVRSNEIPVKLVRFPADSGATVAAVPLGERIILVDGDQIPNLDKIFSNYFTNGLALDVRKLLAIVLLHEAGHIHERHFTAGEQLIEPARYNIEETASKEMEYEADAFAAKQILTAIGETNRFVEVSMPALMLSTTLSSISFNLLGHRVLDNFGATALRRSSVLADKNSLHPNLELRFLRLNYLVSPDTTTKQLYENFLSMREEVQDHPRILFKAD